MKTGVLPILTVIIPAAAASGISALWNIDAQLCFATATLITTAALWLTEALPLPTTALLIPVLIVTYGLGSPAEAFAPFGNPVLFLFIGAFLLARGMQKHRFDMRMAYWLLSLPVASQSLFTVAVALTLLSFVLSMWISNTATVATLCPIVLGIMAIIGEQQPNRVAVEKATSVILLMVAYGSSVGGIATPVGTPPNVITLGFLKAHGVDISFFRWMLVGFPIALLMFLILVAMLFVVLPLQDISRASFRTMRSHIAGRLVQLGPRSRAETYVAGCFFLAVVFWVLPGIAESLWPGARWSTALAAAAPMSTVALLAGLLLFFFFGLVDSGVSVLKWGEAHRIY
ncbi:MAG: anion permease, partial [Bdellovibrionales bacterium]|nr:anion permease [Bdellovibrionales bacterium]